MRAQQHDEGLVRKNLAAKIRVHELAKELGLTNKECLDLSLALGIGVKTHLATGTVEKRIAAVFQKLGLEERGDVNRRVRAVLLYLRESGTDS